MLEELGEKKRNLFYLEFVSKTNVEINGDYCLHTF
jgi:hypothetical protein